MIRPFNMITGWSYPSLSATSQLGWVVISHFKNAVGSHGRETGRLGEHFLAGLYMGLEKSAC
jgi:hypothetical protein